METVATTSHSPAILRASAFGFLSSFGSRISVFGIRVSVGRASPRAAPGSAVVSTASCLAIAAPPAGRRRSREGHVPTASHFSPAESEIRIPESRKKPEYQNPKPFMATTEMVRPRCRSRLALRPSDFLRLSDFGLRNSRIGGASVPASRPWERRRLDGELPGHCRPAGGTPALPGGTRSTRVPFSTR